MLFGLESDSPNISTKRLIKKNLCKLLFRLESYSPKSLQHELFNLFFYKSDTLNLDNLLLIAEPWRYFFPTKWLPFRRDNSNRDQLPRSRNCKLPGSLSQCLGNHFDHILNLLNYVRLKSFPSWNIGTCHIHLHSAPWTSSWRIEGKRLSRTQVSMLMWETKSFDKRTNEITPNTRSWWNYSRTLKVIGAGFE